MFQLDVTYEGQNYIAFKSSVCKKYRKLNILQVEKQPVDNACPIKVVPGYRLFYWTLHWALFAPVSLGKKGSNFYEAFRIVRRPKIFENISNLFLKLIIYVNTNEETHSNSCGSLEYRTRATITRS